MTTRELAEELFRRATASGGSVEVIYLRLLKFLSTELIESYSSLDSGSDRAEARHFAQCNSYFWLPCSLCNQWYGGHESKEGFGFMLTDNTGVCVCPSQACQDEAWALNKQYPNGIETELK